MIFLDTNIVIYSFNARYDGLRQVLESVSAHDTFACSAMVRLEAMGFHNLSSQESLAFDAYFRGLVTFPIIDTIIDKAIALRQQKPIGSPDAIIAATVLVEGGTLWTNNTQDFAWIPNLKWHNPMEN